MTVVLRWLAFHTFVLMLTTSCPAVHARARPADAQATGDQQKRPHPPPELPPGHSDSHRVNHHRLKRARIGAVKQEILDKLGYSDIPDVSNVTTTVAERRRMMRQYRQSLEMVEGRVHELYEEEEFEAKQFHVFTGRGKTSP